MARSSLSRAAASDTVSILSWTQENFGKAARSRYEALLTQSIEEARSRLLAMSQATA